MLKEIVIIIGVLFLTVKIFFFEMKCAVKKSLTLSGFSLVTHYFLPITSSKKVYI